MNMSTTIKMQSRGVLTVPKKVRNHFGWDAGDIVDMEVTDEGVLIKPVSRLSPELQEDLQAALNDLAVGNTHGPFSSGKEFAKYMAKKRK